MLVLISDLKLQRYRCGSTQSGSHAAFRMDQGLAAFVLSFSSAHTSLDFGSSFFLSSNARVIGSGADGYADR